MNKLLGLAAGAAVVLLYWPWQLEPHIRYDDFNFLIKSRTWGEAFANLWLPMNDHAMPLSRIVAAVLMSLVPGPASMPRCWRRRRSSDRAVACGSSCAPAQCSVLSARCSVLGAQCSVLGAQCAVRTSTKH